jgi:hypothetical protein
MEHADKFSNKMVVETATVAYFKLLSEYLPGGTGGKEGNIRQHSRSEVFVSNKAGAIYIYLFTLTANGFFYPVVVVLQQDTTHNECNANTTTTTKYNDNYNYKDTRKDIYQTFGTRCILKSYSS